MSARATARLQVALWAAVMALSLGLALLTFRDFQLGVWHDDAAYVVLARSLLEGPRYGMIFNPGPPLAPLFPAGYPLVLAPVVYLWPGHLEALKIPSVLATLVNGSLIFWGWSWLSRRSRWWGLAITALYLLSPTTVPFSVMVMSEAVFTTFCLAATLLAERLARRGMRPRYDVLLGLLLALIVITRSVGVLVALPLAAYLAWRRRALSDLLLPAAGAGVAVALVLICTPVGLDGLFPGRYLNETNNMLHRVEQSLLPQAEPAPAATGLCIAPKAPVVRNQDSAGPVQAVLSLGQRHLTRDVTLLFLRQTDRQLNAKLPIRWAGVTPGRLIGVLVPLLVGLGFLAWLMAEGWSAFNLWGLVYLLGVLFFWRWTDSRMLYPVQPQMYLVLLLGLEFVTRPFLKRVRWRHEASVVLRVALVLGLGMIYLYIDLRPNPSRPHTGDLALRTACLRAAAPAQAVVMTAEPAIDYLYGGQKTVASPAGCVSPGEFDAWLAVHDIDYLVLAPPVTWQAAAAPVPAVPDSGWQSLLAPLRQAGELAPVCSDLGADLTLARSP